MLTPDVLILGCGYTGVQVAQRCLARGLRVVATTRHPERLARLARAGITIYPLDVLDTLSLQRLRTVVQRETIVLHSVPLVEQPGGPIDPTPQIIKALQDRVERMVYFSTTGVYGNTWRVNEHTPTNPQTLRQQLRLAAEQAVLVGIKSPLVLRPAAIYGPGRNMYESIRQGRYRLVGDDSNFTSYIHVADLAAHAEAAFGATLTGAYPVADDYPCPAREIASYCAELLQMPLPPFVPLEQAHETLRFSRAVDGHAIRRALGISLQYSSYKVGLPASLAEVPTASAA